MHIFAAVGLHPAPTNACSPAPPLPPYRPTCKLFAANAACCKQRGSVAAGSSLRLWLVCNRDVYLPETKCLTGEAWRLCTLLCMWACDSAQACCTPTPVALTLILTCPNLSPVLTHYPHAAVTSTASKVTFPAMDPLYADPLNTVNVTVLDRPNARAAGGWLHAACCCRMS